MSPVVSEPAVSDEATKVASRISGLRLRLGEREEIVGALPQAVFQLLGALKQEFSLLLCMPAAQDFRVVTPAACEALDQRRHVDVPHRRRRLGQRPTHGPHAPRYGPLPLL